MKSVSLIAAALLTTRVVHAQIEADAIALYEEAAGDSTVYSALITSITYAMVALFGVWILVAAFRQWSDGQMQFLGLFMMITRVGLIVSLVSVLFTGF